MLKRIQCCHQDMTPTDRLVSARGHDAAGRPVEVRSRLWLCRRCANRTATPVSVRPLPAQ